MEYFKSSLKSVLGSTPVENESSGADTVERLVDRLQSSTLLSDRRDACRALKALSRTYRVEVGTRGMDVLRQILEMDRTDCEIIGLSLDTLCNITNPKVFEEEVDKHGPKNKIGEQFTEIFIKNTDSVGLVLALLEEFEFKVRWPALKLLMHLSTNRLKDIQEIILVSPMGVSKLMDLLGDSREVIRNDALLLLIQLTKGNANIQKIVAFENAFDRIFDVIAQEGNADGGIVVEDCLLLMLNLLRGNISNQNFFKEGSYIQKLTPMFQIPSEIDNDPLGAWSPQKVSNVHCMVQVIRALVAPNGPAQAVANCQQIMRDCGLLQALCNILMASGVPADVLIETINTVAEVIRGNANNQEFLAGVMAPSSPPRPAIVVLLMSMVNEKQPFALRCSVLYCFQCFLYKNEVGQSQLIQTLLPQGNEVPSVTTGIIMKSVLEGSNVHHKNQMATSIIPDSVLIAQYKEVIREQASQIQKLNQITESLMKEKHELEAQIHDLQSTVSHLKDQNLVLRAAQTNLLSEENNANNVANGKDYTKEMERYKNIITDLENRLAECTTTINEYKLKVEERNETDFERKLKEKSEELEKIKNDQEGFLELLTEQDVKIMLYKERLIALGEKVETDESSAELDTDDQPESSNSVDRVD
ncbi:general vesicular transport factor p115 isoform X4 [Megachile rotundata]|uniref:general vesicular transport factor p115 isoform X4 n=1 Tax=Megachile rotundata TaxID=143995 RepID=UPI003FD34E2F